MSHLVLRPTLTPMLTRVLGGLVTAAVFVATLAFGLAEAQAQDAQRYRDEISQYNQRLEALRNNDHASSMKSEMDSVKKWLEEALVQVGKERYEAVKGLLRRAEVQIDYVEAQAAYLAAKATAEDLEKQLSEAKERTNELENELERMQEKEAKLQKKLDEGS